RAQALCRVRFPGHRGAARLLPRRRRAGGCHPDGAGIVNRRDRVLEALGLTPIWVRRTAPVEERAAPRGKADAGPAQLSLADRPAGERAARIRAMSWVQLKAEVAGCTACALHKTRTQAVFGVGDERAQWLFV